jgi:hypothetical protein
MLKCHQKRAFDFMSPEPPSQAPMSADWMGADVGAQAGPRFQINPAAMASPANKRYRGAAMGAMDIAGEGAGAGAEESSFGARGAFVGNLVFRIADNKNPFTPPHPRAICRR